jgi:Ca-activated chloride channel family protein
LRSLRRGYRYGSVARLARGAPRESIEDLEADLAAGGDAAAIDREVQRIGLEFQIATRRTSWVAISEEPGVDPQAPTRRVRMPQARSTRAGRIGVGRSLRLTLALPGDLGAEVAAVETEELRIEL